MEPDRRQSSLPLMLADATVGRLCKCLRMAGIDTHLDTATPDVLRIKALRGENPRWVLTRSQKISGFFGEDRCLMLNSNSTEEQIRQVIRHFGIRRGDLRPLSRCSQCNRTLSSVSRHAVSGQVPDHVWQSNEQFMKCSRCRRIYWAGSHSLKIRRLIDKWFE